MSAPGRIGCAILAAGASRRLGRPKQLLVVDGQPLIHRLALVACRSSVARTAVVVDSRADDVATAVSHLPVDLISNPAWSEGMASSIRCAVGWARGRHFDGLLIALADQFALTTAHLDALVTASEGGLHVVASGYDDVLGVPAVFPRDCYGRLEGLRGDVGARALLRGADPDFPILTVAWPAGAFDLDRPEDRRSLTARSTSQSPRARRPSDFK